MRGKQKKRRPPEGARKAAWSILLDWETGDEALESIRDKLFTQLNPSRQDRALITELTQGVVRQRLYLQHNVRHHLDKPEAKIPEAVRQALFLGAYQLLCLDRIPAHAAVKETVQIIKESHFRGFSPLVNAVLRRIADKGACWVPDSEKTPLKHIQLTTSTPEWLVKTLADQIGIRTTSKLLDAMNQAPSVTLRVNTLNTTRIDLLEELTSSGIQASPGSLSETAVILRDRIWPREIQPLLEGRCVVQDEGAQMIAPLLTAKPGQSLLDMCAAPGGKTGHLAQLLKNNVFLVAADIGPPRVRMMAQGLGKAGFTCVRYLVADLTPPGLPILPGVFDRILLDAPCSGTGVLRRHPEGKWKKDLNTVRLLASKQLALLNSAAALLRPGGRFLYTTCSVLREENEDVIDRYLSGPEDLRRLDMRELNPHLPADIFTPRGELRLWPHLHNCDGFYACLMEKTVQSPGSTPRQARGREVQSLL